MSVLSVSNGHVEGGDGVERVGRKRERERRRTKCGRGHTITKVPMTRMSRHVDILDSSSRSYLGSRGEVE
jgi:hypothetical protein